MHLPQHTESSTPPDSSFRARPFLGWVLELARAARARNDKSAIIAFMSEPLAYLNGKFLPQSQALLPLHDAGFVMGATVTDLIRTFHHKLYRWQDHLVRFDQSCGSAHLILISTKEEITAHTEESVRYDLPILNYVTMEEITALAEELVRHNAALLTPTQELALVLFATPGPVSYYVREEGGSPGTGPITFGMHTFPLPMRRYREYVNMGVCLKVSNVRQIPVASIPPGIKMRSRMHYWLADREVHECGPGMALLLDTDGYLTETASANVLIVQRGKVLSPPREKILEGISRRVVIELCAKLGIPFEEKPLTVADLESADEAILTCTSYCLMGITQVNCTGISWPGPIFRRLLQAWNEEVGLDIHGQILAQ
jgi:branched-chain amino acid aminotransferase